MTLNVMTLVRGHIIKQLTAITIRTSHIEDIAAIKRNIHYRLLVTMFLFHLQIMFECALRI